MVFILAGKEGGEQREAAARPAAARGAGSGHRSQRGCHTVDAADGDASRGSRRGGVGPPGGRLKSQAKMASSVGR